MTRTTTTWSCPAWSTFRIRQILSQNGYALCFDSPTNQVFCVIENAAMERLAKQVEFG